MLSTLHPVNHDQGDIEDRDAEDHQNQGKFRSSHDCKYGEGDTEKLWTTITHDYFRRIPVVRQKACNGTSENSW